ncbi:MAG: lysine 2,3-aminomutase, partial [Actinopolymorphaceae bacterium]
ISYWRKNYRTGIEHAGDDALERTYEYYDPIDTLPEAGQAWWHEHGGDHLAAAERRAADSRAASTHQLLLDAP